MLSFAYSNGAHAAACAFGIEKTSAWNMQSSEMQRLLDTHGAGRFATRMNMDPREFAGAKDKVRDVVTNLMGGTQPNPAAPLLDVRTNPKFNLRVQVANEPRDVGKVIGNVSDPARAYSNPRLRRENVQVNTFYSPDMAVAAERGDKGIPVPLQPDGKVRKNNPVVLPTRGAEPFHALSDPQNVHEVMTYLAERGHLDEAALRAHPFIATQRPGYEKVLADVSAAIRRREASGIGKR